MCPYLTKVLAFMWIQILTTKTMFDVVNMLKKNTVKDMPIDSYELLNTQTCSFHVFWNTGCTQYLVISCKYWVVPLIYTRVSGYMQFIIFRHSHHSMHARIPKLSDTKGRNMMNLNKMMLIGGFVQSNLNDRNPRTRNAGVCIETKS